MNTCIEGVCFSECGPVRKRNEDNFYFALEYMAVAGESEQKVLSCALEEISGVPFGIFDGMGGEHYGEEASFIAASETGRRTRDGERICSAEDMERLCQALNEAVFAASCERLTAHMGSTAALLSFYGELFISGNLGDSRIYLFREGELRQLSEDHVSRRPLRVGEKAPLIQYLGIDPEECLEIPTIRTEKWRQGDIFLLCSDGITDMIPVQELCDILRSSTDLNGIAEALREKTISNGGHDNSTAILLRVKQ